MDESCEQQTRREFAKSAAAAVGAGVVLGVPGADSHAAVKTKLPKGVEWRNRCEGMHYRRLGRTNFMVSEIGIGCMRLDESTTWLMKRAYDRGVNFFDTAQAYTHGRNEEFVGKALKGIRDKVFIETKASPFLKPRRSALQAKFRAMSRDERKKLQQQADAALKEKGLDPGKMPRRRLNRERRAFIHAELEKRFPMGTLVPPSQYVKTMTQTVEASLKKLQTDYIDVLICPHATNSPEHVQYAPMHEVAAKLKKEGKIRALGLSTHSNIEATARAAIETGKYDVILVAYNVLNAATVGPILKEADAKDVGVIAMKVVAPLLQAKGKAQAQGVLPRGEGSLGSKAFAWALASPVVHTVIPGVTNQQELDEDLALAKRSRKMAFLQRLQFERYASALRPFGCQMCGACTAVCPVGIAVADIVRCALYLDAHGDLDLARRTYHEIDPLQRASNCFDCGACERACPRNVSLREELRRVHGILT